MELKTLYDSRTSLVLIRNILNTNYGSNPNPDTKANTFPHILVNKCWLICTKLKIQPDRILPTERDTIQFEYELVDKSYLEFEIYHGKITILCIEKREYNKAITHTLFRALDLDSIVKDMNLLINLFHTKKFNEIRRLVEGSNNDQNQNS